MNKFAIIVLGAMMLSGCVMVDYTGQKFPETALNKEVKYFVDRKDIPIDEYTIIGRFVVTALRKSDEYTFKKTLLEKARSYGGDAVCFIDEKIVARGAYARKDEEFGAPAASGVPTVSADQRGGASELVGERSFTRRKLVRALLLKKRTDVEKILK